MSVIPTDHQGSRQLLDRYSTRRLANRLAEVLGIAPHISQLSALYPQDADRGAVGIRTVQGHVPPLPSWKKQPLFQEVLPPD